MMSSLVIKKALCRNAFQTLLHSSRRTPQGCLSSCLNPALNHPVSSCHLSIPSQVNHLRTFATYSPKAPNENLTDELQRALSEEAEALGLDLDHVPPEPEFIAPVCFHKLAIAFSRPLAHYVIIII